MTEEINGIFVRYDAHPKIHIYELYHDCVRKYEYLFVEYKSNILKLLISKKAFNNGTLEGEQLHATNKLNKCILKQKELLDQLFADIRWLYNKLNGVFKKHNNSICKATFNNDKWNIEINYKSI
jgi:uncharacterized coiled-coil protein SlyX